MSAKALKTAVGDLKATILKKTDDADIPGIDMVFPLKEDYGGDLEAWAKDVETVLNDEHRADCLKVRNRAEIGCTACRMTSCGRCWWPKTVRYWRRVETGSCLAAREGYPGRLMKAPTALETE